MKIRTRLVWFSVRVTVPANRPPSITVCAPAAIALEMSPEKRMPPSAISGMSVLASALATLSTAVICGTEDKITAVGHSRKLHSRIPGSSLLECEGAGHMVLLERHKEVTAELDDLISLAQALAPGLAGNADAIGSLRWASLTILFLGIAGYMASVLRAHDRFARAEHHIAGEILILGPQAIREPRAQAGTRRLHVTRVHHEQARLVIRDISVHRANDTNVVDGRGHMRIKLADIDTVLAIFGELER